MRDGISRDGKAILMVVVVVLCLQPGVGSGGWLDEAGSKLLHEAGKVVEKGGEIVEKAVQGTGQLAKEGLTTLGKAVEGLGGDGAKFVGQVFGKVGALAGKLGDASAAVVAAGVAKPTARFLASLGDSATALAAIDLRHPETIGAAILQAAGAAVGVVVDVERAAERAAQDAGDIGLTALPAPVEKGIRHASAEVVKEIEKKNPELARVLRRFPITSMLYNYLRATAGDEMTCEPDWIFANLSTDAQKELDGWAKWGALVTSPIKAAGVSGWTTTNCRGTAMGVLFRDAAFSGDNIVTLDLQLVALSVGGRAGPVAGRFLRVEVLPIGRGHEFAMFHRLRRGETVLTSGKLFRDEDGPWLELHPVDDLELVAVPSMASPPSSADHDPVAGYVGPPRRKQAGRFVQYEVKRGDSLASIAERYYGKQLWRPLAIANRRTVRRPNLIFPGYRLNVPVRTTRGVALIGGS